MTESEWLEALATWADIWPDRTLPRTSIATWFGLLADLPGDAVQRALLAWAADPERPWPPRSPGDLRGAVTPPTDWTHALGTLAEAIRRNGRMVRPSFDDPALDEVVRSFGGWTSLCDRFNATDPTTRAQFRDAYTAAAARVQHDQATALAAGIVPALPEGTHDDDRPILSR
jgi:hypothetical protein